MGTHLQSFLFIFIDMQLFFEDLLHFSSFRLECSICIRWNKHPFKEENLQLGMSLSIFDTIRIINKLFRYTIILIQNDKHIRLATFHDRIFMHSTYLQFFMRNSILDNFANRNICDYILCKSG